MTPSERILAGQTRAWLPPSAFEGGMAEPLLKRVVEQWSSDWFAGSKLTIVAKPKRFEAGPQAWIVSNDGVALPQDDKSVGLTAGLLLGGDLKLEALTTPDRSVVQQWAMRCLQQLGDQLAAACDVSVAQVWEAGSGADLGSAWSYSIGLSAGKPVISILLAEDLLVRLLRQAAPPPVTTAKLTPPIDGAGLQLLSLTAFLGRCRLSLGDLASLQAGDVLCLDRLADEPVALAIEHIPSTVACRIEQDGASLTLRLVE